MDKKRYTSMDKQGEYKMIINMIYLDNVLLWVDRVISSLITMNGESIHTIKGEKVNQQIENKKMTCKNGKCSVFNLTEKSDIDESYNERPEWAWLVE